MPKAFTQPVKSHKLPNFDRPYPPLSIPMRRNGRITSWKDDKGFGFITPTQGGEAVFVHISAFINRGRRPAVGEAVTYELARNEKTGKGQNGPKGQFRAQKVALPGDAVPLVRMGAASRIPLSLCGTRHTHARNTGRRSAPPPRGSLRRDEPDHPHRLCPG